LGDVQIIELQTILKLLSLRLEKEADRALMFQNFPLNANVESD
jgi:hypothetical protein